MAECLFRWSAVVVLLAACAGAHAHGIWFAERSGQMALVYGHGAEDLDMIRRHEKVREVAGYDTSGATVPVALRKTDHLRADKDARYEWVAKVMAAAQRAGLRKMGFLTDPADARGN